MLNQKKNPLGIRLYKGILMFSLLVSTAFTLYAQEKKVKGLVTDFTNGEPLIGVSVVIKNTTQGVITDLNGQFEITVPSGEAVLQFSYIGYVSEDIPVDNKTEINVVMSMDVTSLDEVVVVGYGTMRKKDLTGAISSVSSKVIQDIPITSAAAAITGRMAGVQVTTTDGSPDADMIIRVRGGGSVTQDNSPLYIVDGFQVNKISDIAPTDIASIDVLKDASSTAIYGASGANGVVIITTKRAEGGKTTVSYNGYFQEKTLAKELEVLSPSEFTLLQYELASLRGSSALSSFNKYFGNQQDLDIYDRMIGTDWQKKVFGQNTFSQNHNLSIMGGDKATRYNLSLTQANEPGLMIGTGYKRTNLNFHLNHEVGKKIGVEFATRLANTEVDGAGTSDYTKSSTKIRNAVTYRPVNGLSDYIPIDVEDLSNEIDLSSGLADPVTLAQQSYRKQKRFNLNLNGAASWKIMKGLTYRSEFGMEFNFNKDNWFYGPLTNTAKNNGNLPLANMISTTNPSYRVANILTFDRKIGSIHSINAMVGQEVISESNSSITSTARNFPADIEAEKAFALMNLGSQEYTTTSISPDERTASYFGRINYILMERYLFTLTLRADGSSKFAPGKKWGYFPAAAVAWRITDEPFMKQQDILSFLKLRLSLGEAGNNRIPYDSYRAVYNVSSSKPIGFGEIPQAYFQPSSNTLYNPNLRWETTFTRNTGLDFGFLNNKINGTLEFYWNTTRDLLVKSSIPPYLGYTDQIRNIGQTSNRGTELTLDCDVINTNDFRLNVSFNIGFNKSRIDKLDGTGSKQIESGWASTDLRERGDYVLEVGQPVGLIYGYIADGMYIFDDFTYDPNTQTYTLKPGIADDKNIISPLYFGPGNLKLKKLSSDTVMTINPDKDRTVIGNTNPKNTGGINFKATYKNFDLSLFFNWVYGNQIYNANKIDFTTYWNRNYTNMLNIVDFDHRFKYVDQQGNLVKDPTELAALNKNADIWSPFMGRPVVTSWAVEDGSFLRLNNVTLGYSLPKNIISHVKMQEFRVYFTINNAWIWTRYTGYDPEVTTVRSTPLTPGVDYSGYPKSRSYTLGLNVTF